MQGEESEPRWDSLMENGGFKKKVRNGMFFSNLLGLAEEYVLGMKAFERNKKSSKKDFIDIEQW